MLDPSSAMIRPSSLTFGPASTEQQLFSTDCAASWFIPNQSVYQSQTAAVQLQGDIKEHPRLSRTNLVPSDDCPLKSVPLQQLREQPVDVSRLTGVPFKQMTTVGRNGQGSRKVYGLMTNLNGTAASPMGAPGTPVIGQGNTVQAATISTQPKNPKLYKTELCRSWMDHGRCNYGERCQYAHGEHEKRPIPRHPKYKTAYCQSYHQSGYCPYGPRCHFIHNEESSALRNNNNNNIFGNGQIVLPTNNSLLLSMGGTGGSSTPNGTTHNTCGSAGESPVPSSAGSGSESPLGSSSPSLDLDDNASSLSAQSWNNAFIDAALNNERSYFEWPNGLGGMDLMGVTKGGLNPSQTLSSQPSYDQCLLINDLLAWTFEDKSVNKPASEHAVSPVRLPVFAQFSNPSSST